MSKPLHDLDRETFSRFNDQGGHIYCNECRAYHWIKHPRPAPVKTLAEQKADAAKRLRGKR